MLIREPVVAGKPNLVSQMASKGQMAPAVMGASTQMRFVFLPLSITSLLARYLPTPPNELLDFHSPLTNTTPPDPSQPNQ